MVAGCMRALAIAALFVTGCGSGEPAPAPTPAPAAAPARIVSLSPSATEVVAALGAVPQLVGVDTYSKFPAEVAAVAKVGDYLHPNAEIILQMRPTLVIADDVHVDIAHVLTDAHVHVASCPIHTLVDVKACLGQVGRALGRTDVAAAVTAKIDADVAAARAAAPASHPRVLLVLDRDPAGLGNLVAAGPGSYVDELLAVVGGANVLAASALPYPKVSLEDILRARPEVILDLSFAARDGTTAWDALDVPAAHAHRVLAISDETLTAPSPRVGQALGTLLHALALPVK